MTHRFRRSKRYLGCVLPLAIVAVALIPGTAAGQVHPAVANVPSCVNSRTLSGSVNFADLHRAQTLLAHKDLWAGQLSDFDMGARQKTAEPTDLKTFLDFAAAAGRGWTAEEKNNWQVACRLQRNRCADGERHAKARLMNTGKGGKLWRSSRP